MVTKKISITIPAFNEQETIEQVCLNALSSVSKLFKDFEILLVDDGSKDNTGKIMDNLKKKFKDKIRVVHHKKNMGFSGAMKSCYKNANGDYIFLGPADGQFNYFQLKLFISKLIKNKSDIVVAYRKINEESRFRKFNSFGYHMLARLLFGIRLREFSSCLLYKKKVRDSIKIGAHPFSGLFLSEFIYKAIKKGYEIDQVPITFTKRKGGKQKGANPLMIFKTLQEMFRFWYEIKTGKVKL